MMSDLKISLVQFSPQWEDAVSNLAVIQRMIEPLTHQTDVIVLPEMFPTGFSTNPERIAGGADAAFRWMRAQANELDALMLGSMAVEDNGHYYNRMYWVFPDGSFGYYDKRHLFRLSDEPKRFKEGNHRQQFEWKGWRIRPIVCYDLRFPVWCRNTRDNTYDILVCVANWPSSRGEVWTTLLKARAAENLCYAVGVNRTGIDGLNVEYSGMSMIANPKGNTMCCLQQAEAMTYTVQLSEHELAHIRSRFPALNDMDNYSI